MLNIQITASYLATLIIKEYAYHGVYLIESQRAFIHLCVENVDFVIENLQLFLDNFFTAI